MKGKHSANKEQAILEAAEREFIAKGFAGARTTSIAQAAGVTHAMLHYYFRTKELLFERILDEKMRLLGHSILTTFGDVNLPLQQRLREGISNHFDFIAQNPGLPRFIVNEVFSAPERYEVMQHRIAEIAGAILSDLQHELDASAARGETDAVDARMLMLDIVSLNIFIFIGEPIILPIFAGAGPAEREAFLARRKAESIETILRRIQKSNP